MLAVESVQYPINIIVNNRVLKKIVAILFFFAMAPYVTAGSDTNVPMLTRLVQQFTDSEKEVVSALKENNQTTLRKLVADDFELRNSNTIGEPVPRELWLNQSVKAAKNYSSTFEQMAVHDLSDVAVVSFQWQSQSIVDVWVKQQEQWVLKIRYVSSLTQSSKTATNDPKDEVKKKY